jgi:hypothetical protein
MATRVYFCGSNQKIIDTRVNTARIKMQEAPPRLMSKVMGPRPAVAELKFTVTTQRKLPEFT